jgi:hypothetical protein
MACRSLGRVSKLCLLDGRAPDVYGVELDGRAVGQGELVIAGGAE